MNSTQNDIWSGWAARLNLEQEVKAFQRRFEALQRFAPEQFAQFDPSKYSAPYGKDLYNALFGPNAEGVMRKHDSPYRAREEAREQQEARQEKDKGEKLQANLNHKRYTELYRADPKAYEHFDRNKNYEAEYTAYRNQVRARAGRGPVEGEENNPTAANTSFVIGSLNYEKFQALQKANPKAYQAYDRDRDYTDAYKEKFDGKPLSSSKTDATSGATASDSSPGGLRQTRQNGSPPYVRMAQVDSTSESWGHEAQKPSIKRPGGWSSVFHQRISSHNPQSAFKAPVRET